ncbi:hypothetical protein BZA05DRAFT_153211 [Tricharina praecox]|uniref:uncharacterized protein n=1 Tax=Tricharina praecox TaxID=43433 RepID=UPI00221F1B05|nr:uncharacterized protein BZA05DRAFT_153211 [Tricharina praecox]KAI5844882.1 hypothetical protein BZA05DRAFT_153211 [Tricharina praecox]
MNQRGGGRAAIHNYDGRDHRSKRMKANKAWQGRRETISFFVSLVSVSFLFSVFVCFCLFLSLFCFLFLFVFVSFCLFSVFCFCLFLSLSVSFCVSFCLHFCLCLSFCLSIYLFFVVSVVIVSSPGCVFVCDAPAARVCPCVMCDVICFCICMFFLLSPFTLKASNRSSTLLFHTRCCRRPHAPFAPPPPGSLNEALNCTSNERMSERGTCFLFCFALPASVE